MKKYLSQISVALVCCILGFILTYQFKLFVKQSKATKIVTGASADITVEIEQYKQEKQDLEKQLNDLQDKVKNYEKSMSSESDATKQLVDELNQTRILTGTTDVQGSGIVIYLDPVDVLSNNPTTDSDVLTSSHLSYLVNLLKSGEAEAISINDIRITPRTGIRNSGANIMINDEKISPKKKITIKAIGDKKLLKAAVEFPGATDDIRPVSKITYETQDNIKILKYSKVFKAEFAKPVNQ